MPFVAACVVAFLVGGIPFGLIVARVLAGVDIRRVGSGNIGATNAARAFTGHTRGFVFAVIYSLDFLKGFLPTYLLPAWFAIPSPNAPVAIGMCSVLGHCFSPYLRFKGGKGVATTCGVFAAIEPLALLAALAVFGVTYAATRHVFVASLALGVSLALAVILRDPATAFAGRTAATSLASAIAVFLFYTHRSNIRRALAGSGRA
jgi:glycerol-3-phosphate acyltransferase PlsY